jgi:hypothetical protein
MNLATCTRISFANLQHGIVPMSLPFVLLCIFNKMVFRNMFLSLSLCPYLSTTPDTPQRGKSALRYSDGGVTRGWHDVKLRQLTSDHGNIRHPSRQDNFLFRRLEMLLLIYYFTFSCGYQPIQQSEIRT